MTEFPDPQELTGALPAGFDVAALEADWAVLLGVRSEALKTLEEARTEKRIGGSLEAQLRLAAPEKLYAGTGATSRSVALSVHRFRCGAGEVAGEQR